MKKLLSIALLLAIALVAFAATPATEAQDGVELRMLWYNDGNEGDVMQDLLDRFEEETGISVELDTVAFADLHNILQAQVEAGGGEAPDLARVADTARFREFYLDIRDLVADPAYWDENFPEAVLDSFRLDTESDSLHGYPTQFTVTGPFINRTLFEQAGVDVPSDMMEEPTWEDWTTAAAEVAEITGLPYAVAIDRSGHRFWGPSLTMGAEYFDEEGNIVVESEGFRTAAELLVRWHEEGLTPVEVWVGSGDQYASARDEFVTGNLVFYMSGSWQIQAFATDIGDSFDWAAVPNPSGPGGSTGIPGGAVLAGMNTTEHPEEVAMLLDWLASEEILREFTARTLFIPGHIGIANSGVEYDTEDETVLDALNTFLAEVPKLSDQAYALQYSPLGFALNTAIRDRLTQVIVGELTLDEAIMRIQEAVDEAAAEMENAE
ncbi:MAG: extracellular solute-binding protein [Chloroflexi bacterium]|nr:extracellular solute-binding protein [Chloroflexota bacterium]